MSKEISIIKNELAVDFDKNVGPKAMQKIAKQKSKLILSKIESTTQKIKEAQQKSREAENAKGSWIPFSDSATDVRSKLNTEAIKLQSEAMQEMNIIIQESVKLTMLSVAFAKTMIEVMSAMIAEGFTNKDGQLIELNEATKEQADFIIRQAQDFVTHQEEKEQIDKQQSEQISALQQSIVTLDETTKEQAKYILQQAQDFVTHQEEKDQIDKQQSEKLIELENKFEKKDKLDDIQTERLDKYEKQIITLEHEVKLLESLIKAKSNLSTLVISSLALITSIASIVCLFVIK